ncbi:cleavage stimulating factor 64-like isoform X1 [Musa acuminata AAA Group]|uniref:cleavage stimulating factor 64-like isoform X1 n=1 Tax=Musa acuminata AAA Group TaxID=214697 RepID=UPI0031E0BDE7
MAAQKSQQQQLPGDGFTSQFGGLSKAQIYDIMSQMKALMEQNEQQARQILVDNPLLTRALFQAQIMLGMVQPPKVIPNIQQALSQPQPAEFKQPPNIQSSQTLPVEVGAQGESSSSQTMLPARPQHPSQPSISISPASVASLTSQSQAMATALSAPQIKNFPIVQVPSVQPPQSSQNQNISLPAPAHPHYSTLSSHLPVVSVQPQQTLQNPGVFSQVLQPPLPLPPRPVARQPFTHQLPPQIAHSAGFQPSSAPQHLLTQPLFQSGVTPPSSFVQGQPPLPSQPPPQHLYQQVSSHIGPEYGNQTGTGTALPADRGAPWAPGPPEMTKAGTQLPGPPLMATGTSGQPPRSSVTPEMEKALLQQVMSLTPEQINLLSPEQRNQVLQLQEMLRQ